MTRPRSLLAICILALTAGPLAAQEEAQLRRNYEKKLKKDFATKIEWERSLEKAQERAKKEGKAIFAYFTRSYAP